VDNGKTLKNLLGRIKHKEKEELNVKNALEKKIKRDMLMMKKEEKL
jgi:hypoxanthine-guanine phosphoribosyltransferase